jgi:hypothetical protein
LDENKYVRAHIPARESKGLPVCTVKEHLSVVEEAVALALELLRGLLEPAPLAPLLRSPAGGEASGATKVWGRGEALLSLLVGLVDLWDWQAGRLLQAMQWVWRLREQGKLVCG